MVGGRVHRIRNLWIDYREIGEIKGRGKTVKLENLRIINLLFGAARTIMF